MSRARIAVLSTAVLGSGVGHVIVARDRAATLWIAASTAAFAGAVLVPELLLAGTALRIPCCIELWWSSRGRQAPRRSLLLALIAAVVTKLALITAVHAVWMETYKIASGSMAPTVEAGDHIFVFEPAYWFSEPAVGDVVAFESPCVPGKIYVKRVVATAGDRVEIRCGTLYLDDTELASSPAGDCVIRDVDPDGGRAWTQDARCVRESARGASWTVAHPMTDDRSVQARNRSDFPIRETLLPCGGVVPPGSFVPTRGGPPKCPRHRAFVVPPGHVFVIGDNRENSLDSRVWGPVPTERIRGRATGIWWPWGRIGAIE